MTPERFARIVSHYAGLQVALVGDFCLDRYLEIDPARAETSLETGLPVHNVVHVRSQPGASGTILNNLVALGVGNLWPVGFCGMDGEGFELLRALSQTPGVRLDHFQQSVDRRTFTYTKPLLLHPGRAPEELNRLDIKNWTPTPTALESRLRESVRALASQVDVMIVLDQVDVAGTGVVTAALLETLREIQARHSGRLILADSRRGLGGFPPVAFKMNRAELGLMLGLDTEPELSAVEDQARQLAAHNRRPVIITLAGDGLVGALPDGVSARVPALPLRGEIDIVGAGDSVTANLAAAMASGAAIEEALLLASAASSVVIHKLGTTGTASPAELRAVLFPE